MSGLDELCQAISSPLEGHDALPRHLVPIWNFHNDHQLDIGSSRPPVPFTLVPTSGPSRRRKQSLRRTTRDISAVVPTSSSSPTTRVRKRDWRPLGASPSMAAIEERSSPRAAHVRRNSGSAERELCHLYLENERSNPKTPERPKKARKTWQRTVTKGLVEAGVYSAALGLTAYRLWRGEHTPSETTLPVPPEETPEPLVLPTPAPTQGSSPRPRVTSLDHPPPAYEDLERGKPSTHAHKGDSDSLYEPDTPELLTPLQSHTSTLRDTTPHKHIIRYRKPRYRPRPFTHHHSASLSLSHDFFLGQSRSHLPSQDSIDEDDVSVDAEDEEVNRRLDLMAFRLQDLVIEGQAALASEVHVVDVRDDVRVGRRRHLKTASSGVLLRERQAVAQRSSRSVEGSARSRR